MTEGGEKMTAKQFYIDSIQISKRLILSSLRHQYDFPGSLRHYSDCKDCNLIEI